MINEKHLFGIEHCYKQGTTDALIVFFSGTLPTYSAISWFNEDEEYSYLFLKDDPWYTTYTARPYHQVIDYYIKNLDRTIFAGISMGGMAALYHGIDRGIVGIISIDPFPWQFNPERVMKKLKAIPHDNSIKWPMLFVEYATNNSYVAQIKTILFNRPVTIISMPWASEVHGDFIPSLDMMNALFEFMFKMNQIDKRHNKT